MEGQGGGGGRGGPSPPQVQASLCRVLPKGPATGQKWFPGRLPLLSQPGGHGWIPRFALHCPTSLARLSAPADPEQPLLLNAGEGQGAQGAPGELHCVARRHGGLPVAALGQTESRQRGPRTAAAGEQDTGGEGASQQANVSGEGAEGGLLGHGRAGVAPGAKAGAGLQWDVGTQELGSRHTPLIATEQRTWGQAGRRVGPSWKQTQPLKLL